MASPKPQAGFTLLEAIVALVIFSMGAIALYSWLSTNVIALGRIQENREALMLSQSALDMVRRINPMETPSGERRVGDVLITWTAKPIEAPKAAVTQVGLPTIFQAALFDLDVAVSKAGREINRFHVRQVGYRQTGRLEED
ncbi:type II secretion system protein [Lysobacter xinjiangensis]|uniref:Type II secretion system protein n=1 Tax=Cognatilysobacter xinjiangensis TaxID=546892 RepID=A0ABQ3C7F7_9GAMM|nr:type II secretion system protein [Lysobacter xinjiangensis]GGZ70853.1 type II secretion system protein [Lysobacter xinjiangensis]